MNLKISIDWNLLRCAFGKHKEGRKLHDDILYRWITVCKHCGKRFEVKVPVDEDGNPYDPHEWMMMGDEI